MFLTVWVVVPAFNEVESIEFVVPHIHARLIEIDPGGRILVVDDGSTDGTALALDSLQERLPGLAVLSLKRNAGKSAALSVGFAYALECGASTLVMMDADGQDDPEEMRRLISEVRKGTALVTGARTVRQDRFIKRSTSRLYNRVTGLMTGVPGSDFNSGFKAMSAGTARDLIPMLYGDLHRYLTVIAFWSGHSVTEVPVTHHPREHGQSKYGVSRFWRGFIDLLTVRFIMSYEARPSHLFGGLGFAVLALGSVLLGYLTVLRIAGETIGDRPLLVIAVLLIVVGLQLLLFGLLAELTVYGRQTARVSGRLHSVLSPASTDLQAGKLGGSPGGT